MVITPREGIADTLSLDIYILGFLSGPLMKCCFIKSNLRSFRFSPFSLKQFSEENLVVICIFASYIILLLLRGGIAVPQSKEKHSVVYPRL